MHDSRSFAHIIKGNGDQRNIAMCSIPNIPAANFFIHKSKTLPERSFITKPESDAIIHLYGTLVHPGIRMLASLYEYYMSFSCLQKA